MKLSLLSPSETLSVVGNFTVGESNSASLLHSPMKRRSLPCPNMGSLNWYSDHINHQDRRFSESRGGSRFMIYGCQTSKPQPPDIDLISHFTTIWPNKKSISHPFGSRRMTVSNVSGDEKRRSITSSRSLSSFPELESDVESKLQKSKKTKNEMRRVLTDADVFAGGSESNNGFASGVQPEVQLSNTKSCRKVRLKLSKIPSSSTSSLGLGKGGITSATTTFIEMQTIEPTPGALNQSIFSTEKQTSFTFPIPPEPNSTHEKTISHNIIDEHNNNMKSFEINSTNTGIICSTGDLLELKCLTSSASEIHNNSMARTNKNRRRPSFTSFDESLLGNRSKSFDATTTFFQTKNKETGSSWFIRRHLPISAKFPLLPINSRESNMSTDESSLNGTCQCQCPLGSCLHKSVRATSSPKTKVTWDCSDGLVSFVDACILGSLIENHLIKTNQRRATLPEISNVKTKNEFNFKLVGGRARSVSVSFPKITTAGSSFCNLNLQSTTSTEDLFGESENQINRGKSGLLSSFENKKEKPEEKEPSLRIWNESKSYSSTVGSAGSLSNSGKVKVGENSSHTVPSSVSIIVKSMKPNGKVNTITTTSTTPKSSIVSPTNSLLSELTYHGRICTQDEFQAENQRRRAYYKHFENVNSNSTKHGIFDSIFKMNRPVMY